MGAIEKIRAQQAQLKDGSPAWAVGEQLAELCAAEPESERLVDVDLDNAGMALAECEKKVKAWADGHRQGNFAYVSPQKAEEIIREFYGLPGRNGTGGPALPPGRMEGRPGRQGTASPAWKPEPAGGAVNLLDFL